MNPYEMVGKVITLSGVPGFISPYGEREEHLTQLNGRFEVVDFDNVAEQFYLVTEEDGQALKGLADDQEYPFAMYYVDMGYVDPTEEMIQEVDSLQSQFDMPAVEHPLGPHTGADLLNTPSETPRYDIPFEETEEAPAEGKYTEDEYASIPEEVNQRVIEIVREMRAAGTPMPEIMRHAREMIEAWISANRRVAYTEGMNWYHGDGANWCEDCVKAGKAPQNAEFTGPVAENRQIACAGCSQQEGTFNREYGRDLVEKMPQNPKLPGIGTIPVDLDVVKRAPGKNRDLYDRKKDYYSSIERLNVPDEHLGWHEAASGEENIYYTLNLDEGGVQGALVLLQYANLWGVASMDAVDNLVDYIANALASDDHTLRLNADEFDILDETSDMLTQRIRDLGMKGFLDSEWGFVIDSPEIIEELRSIALELQQAAPEESSVENLEDIPTMNEFGEVPKLEGTPEYYPEERGGEPAPRPGLFEGWTFEQNPRPNDECPQCGSKLIFTQEGIKACDNCGWVGYDEPKPKPSALSPSTPAAKAMAAGTCPKCGGGPLETHRLDSNKFYCPDCGWEDTKPPALSDAAKQVGELESQFELPSAEHPLGPHTGSEHDIAYYCENCNHTFGGISGIDPDKGCPFCQGPLQVFTGIDIPEEYPEQRFASNQELYTSGSFVKGPDGRWLVAINPAAGQRDPEPGDWAQIIQRTKSFNRPVPLTLVEDMGGAWRFKNGHHPSLESPASEDEAI